MKKCFSHLVGRKHQSKQNSFSKWGTGVKKTLISATCDEYFDILNVRDSSYIAVTLKWGSMVFIYGEINPLTISAAVLPMIAQSTCPCSFLFRDIWPLISLREKEESESVTNSINHFPFSSLYYTCMECKSIWALCRYCSPGFTQPRFNSSVRWCNALRAPAFYLLPPECVHGKPPTLHRGKLLGRPASWLHFWLSIVVGRIKFMNTLVNKPCLGAMTKGVGVNSISDIKEPSTYNVGRPLTCDL